MKFFETYRNFGGGYTTAEWTGGEEAGFDLFILAILAIAFSLFSFVISLILVFVTIHDWEDEKRKPSIIGFIMSLYFVLDMTNGWVIAFIFDILFSNYWQAVFLNLNIVYLLMHFVLIFFGGIVHKGLTTKFGSFGSFLYFCAIGFFLFIFLQNVANKPKVETQHVETSAERKERIENGDFRNKEEEKEYYKYEESFNK